MSHWLEKFLSVEKETDNPEWILNDVPPGWRKQFREIVWGLQEFIGVKLTGVAIKDGILYIRFTDKDLPSQPKRQLAEFVTKRLLQESAQTCMVCGQYARRRKEQAHKPALCRTHYLEYINALED